jgi:hypothetical protein
MSSIGQETGMVAGTVELNVNQVALLRLARYHQSLRFESDSGGLF